MKVLCRFIHPCGTKCWPTCSHKVVPPVRRYNFNLEGNPFKDMSERLSRTIRNSQDDKLRHDNRRSWRWWRCLVCFSELSPTPTYTGWWRRVQRALIMLLQGKSAEMDFYLGRLFCRTPVAIYMEQKKTLALETKLGRQFLKSRL
jgi:hypothetical protein